MLVAARGLHGGDDLAGDAELREVAEARLAVGAEVADRLVEADEPLLDQVLRVAAEHEVRRGLQADEAAITADQPLVGVRATPLGERDQVAVLKLWLSLSSRGRVRCRARTGGLGRYSHWSSIFGWNLWRPYLPWWAPSPLSDLQVEARPLVHPYVSPESKWAGHSSVNLVEARASSVAIRGLRPGALATPA